MAQPGNTAVQCSGVIDTDTQAVPADGTRGTLVGLQALSGTGAPLVRAFAGTSNAGVFLGEARLSALVPTMFPAGTQPEFNGVGLFLEVVGTTPAVIAWYTGG